MPAVTLEFDGATMNGLQVVLTWNFCEFMCPPICSTLAISSLRPESDGLADDQSVVQRLQSATRCHTWPLECYSASRLYLRHPI